MKSFDGNVKSSLQEHIQSLRILNKKLLELDAGLKDLCRKGLDQEIQFLLVEIQNVRNEVKTICCNAKYSIIKEVEKQSKEERASDGRFGESSNYYSPYHYDRFDDDDDTCT